MALVDRSLDNVVWSDVVVARHRHSSCLHRYPHIDEVLRQSHCVRVASDGDSPVGCSSVSLLAVADANHRSAYLPDLSDLRASFADDAADEIVGHSHLVSLLVAVLLVAVWVVGPQLASCQRSQRCGIEASTSRVETSQT